MSVGKSVSFKQESALSCIRRADLPPWSFMFYLSVILGGLNLLVNKHNVLGLDPRSVAVIFDLISEKNVI